MVVIFFMIGLCLGSFLNAFEWRLRTKQSLWERSKCPKCQRHIFWFDNIPLLSFVILKGKCRWCKEKISWQYPLVELCIGLSFACIAFFNMQITEPQYVRLVLNCFIVWILFFIFVYDIKYLEVADLVVLPAVGIIFVISWIFGFHVWYEMVISMLVGAGFFLMQYVISKGKWVGGGDARIGLFMGAVLGWKLLLVALWIAYVVGALVSVILLLTKKKNMKSEVPFGTFLSVATVIVMFWGQPIINWYIGLLY